MENYFDLTGQVAVVTGASSGLGVQYAKALANQGAQIDLIARREEKLKAVKEEIESSYDTTVRYYPLDLTEFDKIQGVVDQIEKDFGKIDILVNNAGIARGYLSKDFPQEDWLAMINTNLNAVFFMAQAVGNVMIKNKYGRVINIGSVHSNVSIPYGRLSAYVTTKFGVRGLTIALAQEWAQYNITVNAIGPAYFKSEMTEKLLDNENFKGAVDAICPMKRIGNPGELNSTLLYFASKHSSYTTGQLITVDGGWTTV